MTFQEFYDRFFPDMPIPEWQSMMIEAWLSGDRPVTHWTKAEMLLPWTVTITITRPDELDTVLEDEMCLVDTELE